MKAYIRYMVLFLNVSLMTTGCTKDFLDKKPNTSILQPTSLDDYQNLLENNSKDISSGLGILAADEYKYKSYASWLSTITATERNSYIWAKDILEGEIAKGDWSAPYIAIFYANNILAGLSKIEVTGQNKNQWDMIKGWALFVRANAYYDLVRTYSPAYNASTANSDLGIPLRTDPSIDEILSRASVQQTFDRIITDLEEATTILGASIPNNRNRPSKVAAYALKARIYLNMREYSKAEINADQCLQLHHKLIDFNVLNVNSNTPFLNITDESIYLTFAETYVAYAANVANTYTVIADDLIALYQPGDLRLNLFYTKQVDGTFTRKPSNVSGTSNFRPFTGLAFDEIYLIKAECMARRGEYTSAMDFLNQLLIKRYKTNEFVPLTALSASEALNKILLERRKELVLRGLRWDDLKRLNKEDANITLARELDGINYTIAPNSPRYVFQIPDNEISLGGIVQNER